MNKIKLRNFFIGGSKPVFISGNCVIENERTSEKTLRHLLKITKKEKVPFIYKISFDKANRSSHKSYRGPGIKEGVKLLKKLKQKYNVPLLADIHLPQQAEEIAAAVDIIQIPAFLCRQTDLIKAAAQTKKIINIKKGQFLSPYEVKNIIDKCYAFGNKKIFITERGCTFGYNNWVVDMRAFHVIKSFGVPVIFDATHSVQTPGGEGKTSGGRKEFIFPLAMASSAAGADGIYFETHPDTKRALSDGANMLELKDAENLISQTKKIINLTRGFK